MKSIKLWAVVLLIAMVIPKPSIADRSVPIYVINHPTAGLLGNGEYLVSGRIGPQSSILMGLRIGFRNIFQIGTSFGMQKLFDRGDIDVNDKLGFQFRLRLLEEYVAPALAIGFDSQGRGFYHDDQKRYDRKSPGFYVVLSKNYMTAVGGLALHGGVNYSTENKDDDDPDLFLGSDWSLIERFSILFDLDSALNDNLDNGPYGKGGVYLDAALRLNYGDNLSLMFIFSDLTNNFRPASGVGRELEISFWDSF